MAKTEARSDSPTVVTVDLGSRSYDILIGRGVLERVGMELARRMPGRRVAVVTDETVARFHLNTLSASLSAAEIAFTTITVPPGEKSKSFETLTTVAAIYLAISVLAAQAVKLLEQAVRSQAA